VVSGVENRRDLSLQGPVKFSLSRADKIASAGSCFAQRIAERLPQYGLTYFVAEASAAPYSARYGNVYSARQLAQLFGRAFGRFDPLERAWETPEGRFLDPFRPSVEPGGFPSINALEADRRAHLAAVARLFTEVDVFVYTLGLTEIWSDARDGAVFPTCPGRGRGTYDPMRHVYSNLDVTDTCAALDSFLEALAEINRDARVILTVSPVAIAATMEPKHVVRASLTTKSILKIAAETTARRHANVDYFAAYDTVVANVGGERFFAPDGRHVRDEVADRIVRLLVESYFGLAEAEGPKASEAHLEAADDCDEDRLLKLLERNRSRAPAAPAHVGRGERVAHPIPLYFAGDSGTFGFRNCIFSVPGYRQPFVGCTLHARALQAAELTDHAGRLNATMLTLLVDANLLTANGHDSYRVTIDAAQERFRKDPPLLLYCGSHDIYGYLQGDLAGYSIELPAHVRPRDYPVPHVGQISFDDAKGVALGSLGPFERGLRLLRSYGFANLAVHMCVPPGREISYFYPNPWSDMHTTYALRIVMNAAIAEICAKVEVPFVDIWSSIVGADGLRDTSFTFDSAHLNARASILSVRRMLEMLEGRAVYA
jgi:hypothetical protein